MIEVSEDLERTIRHATEKAGFADHADEIINDVRIGTLRVFDTPDSILIVGLNDLWVDLVVFEGSLGDISDAYAGFFADWIEYFEFNGIRWRGREGWARRLRDYVTRMADGSFCMTEKEIRRWAQKHQNRKARSRRPTRVLVKVS